MATATPTTGNYLSPHVSQYRYEPDGKYDGNDDCGYAECERILGELGKLQVPADEAGQVAIEARLRAIATGQAEYEGQGGSVQTDLEKVLSSFGVQSFWTTDYETAKAAAWSIVLIDGTPTEADGSTPYSVDWLSPTCQHWIAWLKELNGDVFRFNDSLALDKQDHTYQEARLQQIFCGAVVIVLPGTQARVQMVAACGLKVQPNHTCSALAQIPAGGQCLDLGTRVSSHDSLLQRDETWAKVQYRDRYGYVPASNIAPLPAT